MAGTYRRITRVVMGSTDDSQEGIWLDDGSRLIIGNATVTSRALFANRPATQQLTIEIMDPHMAVEIHPVALPPVLRSAQGDEI